MCPWTYPARRQLFVLWSYASPLSTSGQRASEPTIWAVHTVTHNPTDRLTHRRIIRT